MEIGQVNENTNMLEIVKTYPTNPQLFCKVRGSTTFTETEDGLVGLVHFSEEHLPRHYYHMLVLLEKETFRPLKYSEVFYFQKLGVEFCIGMAISNSFAPATEFSKFPTTTVSGNFPLDDSLRSLYRFWISRLDRDPMMVTVPVDQIPLKFEVC